MNGKELAELCKRCKNVNICSPRGYVCPALERLWRQGEKVSKESGMMPYVKKKA